MRIKALASKDSLLKFLLNQITVENEIVESINKSLDSIKNPPVKGVLKGISLDSTKHGELYSAAITLLTESSRALTQENLDEQRALVEKHIRIESELIDKLESMIPSIENKKVVFLLKNILGDERRHHAMLKLVLDIIVKGETITEDDWWKMLWENVPFHGSPGG